MAAALHIDDYCVVRDGGTGDLTCTVTAPALDVDGAWGSSPLLKGAVLYRNTVTHSGSPIAEFALAIVYNGPPAEELAFYQDGSICCKGKGLRKGAQPGKGPPLGPGPGPAPDSDDADDEGGPGGVNGAPSSGLEVTPGSAVVKGSGKGSGAASSVRPTSAPY